MRTKRAKQYKKLLIKYSQTFGFREPYQILVDASIIRSAASFKMRLGSMLSNTLSGEIKPMITQCCIRHLYDLPTTTDAERREKDEWIEVAKQAERRRCGHHELPEALSALECILSVVDPKGSGSNKNRYVVASQEVEIRTRMRAIAGVPLIYINRSVMILEPMAAKSEQLRASEEKAKVRAGLKGSRPAANGDLKRKRDDEEADVEMPDRARMIAAAEGGGLPAQKKQKAKGSKGPNPLSVKKATKPKSAVQEAEDESAVMRRVAKKDVKAAENVPETELAGEEDATEAPKKRKRKRKVHEESGEVDGGGKADEPALLETASV